MKKGGFKFFRNTFSEGMKDTFDIMIGNHGILDSMNGYKSEYQFGLLDLLVIPYIARAMCNYGFPTKDLEGSADRIAADDTHTGLFRRTIGVIGLALEVLKSLAALVFTFALVPIVLAVHIIKYPFSKYLENRFYALDGEHSIFTGTSTFKVKKSLGNFAKENDLTLNELVVEGHGGGTSVSIDVPYQGMASIYDSRSTQQFFASASSEPEEQDALFAGKLLGYSTY